MGGCGWIISVEVCVLHVERGERESTCTGLVTFIPTHCQKDSNNNYHGV